MEWARLTQMRFSSVVQGEMEYGNQLGQVE